jgi:putative solute:sodium symporter small subunit
MHIKNGKDFWAGLMFAGAGLSFMLVSQNYPMGSAVRMGPAYFPTMLGGLLAILGAVIFFRAFFSKIDNPVNVFPFRLPVLVASLVIGGATYFADSWFKNAPMAEFALTGLSLALFIAAFGPRAMFVILIAVVIYGYALKPLGLVLATVILIVMSALGGHDFRKKEVVILTIVMALFSVFVFVKGLGLPFNLWPGE